MYIAGLYVSDPSQRFTEGLVLFTLVTFNTAIISTQQRAMRSADSKGGKITRLPSSPLGTIATFTQAVFTFAPALVYLFSVAGNGLEQPAWLRTTALPHYGLSDHAINWVRIAACISMIGPWQIGDRAFRELDSQLHYIGVSLVNLRKRP